jgi:hypothetical protein
MSGEHTRPGRPIASGDEQQRLVITKGTYDMHTLADFCFISGLWKQSTNEEIIMMGASADMFRIRNRKHLLFLSRNFKLFKNVKPLAYFN